MSPTLDPPHTPEELSHSLTAEERERVHAEAAVLAAEAYARRGAGVGCKAAVRAAIRQRFATASSAHVLELARALYRQYECPWFAMCMVRFHEPTFAQLDASVVEEFGRDIASARLADVHARVLSGPAWLHGRIDDQSVMGWTRSADAWRRRIAAVSTVTLNVRGLDGGRGDTPRTLAVCRELAGDADPIVHGGLVAALRALCKVDRAAVPAFLAEQACVLPLALADRLHRGLTAR
ncbi:MAG: DNA alkylation repair protein [Planctomycetota bacterium]